MTNSEKIDVYSLAAAVDSAENVTRVGRQWSAQELALLGHLSSINFPIDHVAKFLGRDIDEVRKQTHALYKTGK